MSIIKCYDVAEDIINEATNRFSPIWKIDTEKLDIFKNYCDSIDLLVKEFEGVSIEVEVDEITMEVTIVLECGEIIVESSTHILYELIKRAIRYGFAASTDDNLFVKFVFPPLWEKA